MKKFLLLAFTILMTLSNALTGTDQQDFLRLVEDALYQGSRSGRLTKKEAHRLYKELNNYEKTLWKYEANGKISRRERKKLQNIEEALDANVKQALFNNQRVERPHEAMVKRNKKFIRGWNNGPICRPPTSRKRERRF